MELDQETYDLIRTTSSDVKHIRELLDRDQEDIKDHETRIRKIEAFQAKLIGIALAVSAAISAFVVWVQNWFGGGS